MAEEGRAVLKIPVDTSEWDAFIASVTKYREMAKNMPHAKIGIGDGSGTGKAPASSFSKAAATAKKISADPTLTRRHSFIVSFEQSSANAEKSWFKISKHVGATAKSMSVLGRIGVGFSAFGTKLAAGATGVAAAGFGAIVAASSDLAKQNAQNRELGLAPGRAQAFTNNYQKMGGDDALLAKIAEAKTNPAMWPGLLTAGITPQEIQSEDPTKLAAQFLQRGGHLYKQMGAVAGAWASGARLTDFSSALQLNKAGSYDDDAYRTTGSQFETDVPRLALRQQELDKGTAAKAQFDSAFDSAKNSIAGSFVKLAPLLTKLTTEFAATVKAFSDSGELQKDADSLVTAFNSVATAGTWVADKLNALFGAHADQKHDIQFAPDDWKSKTYAFGVDTWDALRGHPHAPTDTSKGFAFDWDWNKQKTAVAAASKAKTDNALLRSLDSDNGLPPGFLQNIERQESANGRNMGPNDNSSAGPAGWFQLDRATAKRFGVLDRMNESQAGAGAAEDFSKLMKKYGGDTAAAIASYDGFSGLDKDIARYGGDWRNHLDEFGSKKAVAETKKYLGDIQANGTDLSYTGDSGKASMVQQMAALVRPIKALTASMGGTGKTPATASTGSTSSTPAAKNGMLPMPMIIRVDNRTGADIMTQIGSVPQ